jgi:hypothetical protein
VLQKSGPQHRAKHRSALGRGGAIELCLIPVAAASSLRAIFSAIGSTTITGRRKAPFVEIDSKL